MAKESEGNDLKKVESRATIMMVTYNRLNLTQETFNTTLSNAGERFNLIIVDNKSEDGTIEWLKDSINKYDLVEYYKIVELRENKGIAYGRNMCLKTYNDNFSTRHLCTLDNDVALPDGWLTNCCDVLENNSKIGACGVNLEDIRYHKAFIKIKKEDRAIEIQIKPRGNLGTAAMVFEKDMHRNVGYFCGDYKMYAHEDADMGFRFRMVKPMLVYLGEQGVHLGVGDEDSGEYRKMKNKYWDINMPIYNNNVRMYMSGAKPIYIDFVPDEG